MMNACIVGYGSVGPIHALSLSQSNCANIYAICDADKERADKGAKEYNAKAFYDYDECLQDKNIDCVHICTPHYLHFEMIKSALLAGKKVIAEKPVTMKKEEFYYLFENFDTTNIFPIIQNRTNLCIKKLAELISSNNFGKITGAKGILTWCRDESYYKQDHWRGKKEFEGGGVLINQAVHTLDLMMFFCGKAKNVEATMKNYSLKGVIDVEDTVDAYIEFENGAKGIFYATNAHAVNSSVELEFEFEKARLLYTNGKLFLNGECVCEDSSNFLGKHYWGMGHARTLCDFYSGESTLSLCDIKNTMDAMFAIYESAEKGKEITI